MIPKIDWREILHLYGLTLLAVTGFFLLGLYVGRSFPVEVESARLAKPEAAGPSGSESRPRLEFYGGLNDPATRGADAGDAKSAQISGGGARGTVTGSGPRAASSGGGRFTVQIAVLEREEEARREMIRIRSRGYLAEIRRLGSSDRFYRVWIGDFSSKEEAHRLADRLYQEEGIQTYVRSTSDSP